MNMHPTLFGPMPATAIHAAVRLPGRPLIVDSFAGGGGASTGIEMALGRSPDIAINHNEAALALHAANHPETLHLSENVWKVDPLDYIAGRHVGLMHFSPDCKHFSKAKGGKPVERNIRDLCWIIPGWIERLQKSGGKVDVVTMENVEEFRDYGPLIETDRGLMPDPARKGETFAAWCKALRRLGGRIEFRELRACDFGAPTIRKRFFAVIRFDGKKIEWPEPTHGAPDDPDVIAGKKLPWRVAAEIIDWSLPCPSIFDTTAEVFEKHGLRAVRPLADNTMARVARGMKRYVLDAERPFLVSIAHGDSGGRREYSVDETFGVVTAGGIGHAVVAPSITRFNSGATGSDCREPIPTITANSYIQRPGGAAPLGVVAPHLAAYYGPGEGGLDRSAPVDEPVRVIPCENRHAVVAPHLMTMRNSGKPFNGADEPTHTITAGGAGLTVVAPVLSYAQQGGACRSVEQPHHTICASTKDQNSVIVPTLVGCGGRAGQSRPRGGDEPIATITAKADVCVAAAFVAQHNNDSRREGGVNPGRAAGEPLSTVTASGAQQGVVSAFLHAYYGVDQDTPHTEPLHTLTTKPRFGHVEAGLDAPPFSPEQEGRARQVADFLRAHGFWDEREFVTLQIGGETYVVVDIGLRMLTPRELYSAQGFPADYIIDGAYVAGDDGEPRWTPFPKSVQVSCVGNSVSPYPYAALVAANCGHLAVAREAAE